MKTTSGCFSVLRQLRGIRRSAPILSLPSLVSCLVLPRLNYCNALLLAFHYTLHGACFGDERGRTARLRVIKVLYIYTFIFIYTSVAFCQLFLQF